jgi:phosphoribosyl 1,2-cyclic phosphodiesterase
MLHPLASSSAANTAVVDTGAGLVVIDAGLPRLDTLERMGEIPQVMLLTHEHHDHSHYSAQWTRAYAAVYATFGQHRIIRPWTPIEVADGAVATAMPISHDALAPVAWRVAGPKCIAVVATDLGEIPPGFTKFVEGATDLLLEASYHPRLLAACHYIAPIKARIGGREGHLSALDALEWLRDGLPDSVQRVWLGHLSKAACDAAWLRLAAADAIGGRNVELTVLEG